MELHPANHKIAIRLTSDLRPVRVRKGPLLHASPSKRRVASLLARAALVGGGCLAARRRDSELTLQESSSALSPRLFRIACHRFSEVPCAGARSAVVHVVHKMQRAGSFGVPTPSCL